MDCRRLAALATLCLVPFRCFTVSFNGVCCCCCFPFFSRWFFLLPESSQFAKHTHTNTEIWMRDRHCVLCRSSAACLFSVRPLADILSTESGCAFPPLLIAGRKLASLGKRVWVSEWVSVCSCCCFCRFCCYFVLLLLLLAASDSFHGDAEHKWRQRAQLVWAICRAALCAQSLLPNWASIGHGQARPSSSRPTRSVGLHCRTFRREKTDSDWLNSSISSIGTGLSLLPLQCTWVWIADRGLLQN